MGNRWITFLVYMFLVCRAGAWDTDSMWLRPLPSAPCLNTKQGRDSLLFPGVRERFNDFYARLDTLVRTGEGSLNILHIGGSHVQAGFFSQRVRENLSSLVGPSSAGRGLFFPFRVMKTNAPSDDVVTCSGVWQSVRCVARDVVGADLGLSGVQSTTSDTLACLQLSLRSLSSAPLSRLRVLGQGSTSDVYPIIICDGDTLLPVVAEGGPGYCFDLPETADSCAIRFQGLAADSLSFTLRGLFPERKTSGLTYTSAGINGASVLSWLRCTRFQEDLSLLPPHLVVLGIGINDANVSPVSFDAETFKSNYRQLIQRVLDVNPSCCFVFITNNDCWFNYRGRRRQYNTNTPRVQKAMKELSAEYNAAVFDVFELMGGLRSSARWVRAGLQRADHIHFTRKGYELWGDMLYNALVAEFMERKPMPMPLLKMPEDSE